MTNKKYLIHQPDSDRWDTCSTESIGDDCYVADCGDTYVPDAVIPCNTLNALKELIISNELEGLDCVRRYSDIAPAIADVERAIELFDEAWDNHLDDVKFAAIWHFIIETLHDATERLVRIAIETGLDIRKEV